MEPRDFPPDHPIHKAREGYLVQKFIDTGSYPVYQRIQTFFGKVMYSWRTALTIARTPLDAPDAEIERAVIDTKGDKYGAKDRKLVKDPDVERLAARVHAQFPEIPILGCDVICEAATQILYILECNPGGNTWHISSKIGEEPRLDFGNVKANGFERANQLGRRKLIEQYGAFRCRGKDPGREDPQPRFVMLGRTLACQVTPSTSALCTSSRQARNSSPFARRGRSCSIRHRHNWHRPE
jgi:hypothetical protein